MATSKNNIKNAAQPRMMTSSTGAPLDDKDDIIDAKLDSFVDDVDGQYSTQYLTAQLVVSLSLTQAVLSSRT